MCPVGLWGADKNCCPTLDDLSGILDFRLPTCEMEISTRTLHKLQTAFPNSRGLPLLLAIQVDTGRTWEKDTTVLGEGNSSVPGLYWGFLKTLKTRKDARCSLEQVTLALLSTGHLMGRQWDDDSSCLSGLMRGLVK